MFNTRAQRRESLYQPLLLNGDNFARKPRLALSHNFFSRDAAV